MKRCSASPVIGDMQIKTTGSYQLTPVKMPILRKISVHKDVEKRELLRTVGRNVNGTATMENDTEVSQG